MDKFHNHTIDYIKNTNQQNKNFILTEAKFFYMTVLKFIKISK